MADWTDSIVGDRMQVDQEFNDRIAGSEFSSQEWGLIMTATEFEIEHADDPDRARIVADTEKLPQMMPELERVRSQVGSMGGAAGGGGGGGRGFLDSLKGAFGLGGDDGDEERLRAAEKLTQEYADRLQKHLESNGKWDRVRADYQK
jgi:hypothetical protein